MKTKIISPQSGAVLDLMSGEMLFLKLYRRQGTEFKTWLESYFEAAFCLHCIVEQIGRENLPAWICAVSPAIDLAICEDMLQKLHHTPTGRQVLAINKPNEPFKFPQ